ncbi:MAG: Asp-tRNA(Asn)/Glu-tRNA(Gln) amidotransferase GatCAB subunit A, partial [Gammaproteobacteria bacterium]|nr:Asp-tRNA(Asn)/Glu-tRNA(Gln) amidotransferase GatCAB subunit A [Gammaproteobacteria bacterium]NIO61366.1 Asp-tRNA(Asn)/Glu-tRNA(Gln) amidotransferase GatCAB subunit A [Gammaproteobacteria bacterium]
RELTESFLHRAENFNPELNCFITINNSLALEQAQLADKKLANGDAGPLTGIPV